MTGNGLSYELLRLAMRIRVRGVDQVYSGIQRRVHDIDALLLVAIAIGAEHHGSQSVCAHADAGSSERAIFHGPFLRGPAVSVGPPKRCLRKPSVACYEATLISSRSCDAAARSVCVCAERSGHIAAISLAACITKLAFRTMSSAPKRIKGPATLHVATAGVFGPNGRIGAAMAAMPRSPSSYDIPHPRARVSSSAAANASID